tara:strand:- start:389 stop:1123 length:735 start_codon:yes stop_codon:yes gene_type:complete
MKIFKEIREKYRSKFPPALVAAAVKIALDMGGNMTGAYKKIERMKRGLGDDPMVKDALRLANEEVQNENYNQDLALATKNIARLSKKEKGQDQKDYQAVSRALAQGNLGAVKKVIKGISTKEIQADLLNVLVGYNDLIGKMYPKAMSGGKFKSGMTVDKMVKEETVINELNFSYAFFDKQSLNKFMMKALKVKGGTVLDSEKQTGGHFTVKVKADDKKVIAKYNAIALKAMSEWVEELYPEIVS